MKTKLIPAPIDEKNVTTDWIESVFDGWHCITGGRHNEIYAGFVDNRPVTCFINGNTILWHIEKYLCGVYVLKDTYAKLLRHLKTLDEETPDIVVEYDTSMQEELVILQSFFFKEE